MKTRTFKEVQEAVDAGEAHIKPYSNAGVEDRFRSEIINPLLGKEHERDLLAQQNDLLAQEIAADQQLLEERSLQIDNRAIGLFAFQMVIACWARFLDSRDSAARVTLKAWRRWSRQWRSCLDRVVKRFLRF
jgi:hypothetical protein